MSLLCTNIEEPSILYPTTLWSQQKSFPCFVWLELGLGLCEKRQFGQIEQSPFASGWMKFFLPQVEPLLRLLYYCKCNKPSYFSLLKSLSERAMNWHIVLYLTGKSMWWTILKSSTSYFKFFWRKYVIYSNFFFCIPVDLMIDEKPQTVSIYVINLCQVRKFTTTIVLDLELVLIHLVCGINVAVQVWKNTE